MQNIPLSETASNQEKSKAEDTLEPLESPGVVDTQQELKPLSPSTTPDADTGEHLIETSLSLDYPALRLHSSLIAGYLGMFRKINGGRVKSETVILTQPNGRKYKAIRVFLAIDETDLEVVETSDGVDFVVESERVLVE